MCVIIEKKLQLNIARLCCHNFLSLVVFWLGGGGPPAPPPWLRLWAGLMLEMMNVHDAQPYQKPLTITEKVKKLSEKIVGLVFDW